MADIEFLTQQRYPQHGNNHHAAEKRYAPQSAFEHAGAKVLCFQCGQASLVAPVDKLSVVIVAVLGVAFLGEKLDIRQWAGIGLITVGVVVLAWRR